MDPHESSFRAHVEGKASVLEEREAEKHMQGCADCRELADFAHDLSAGIKELGDEMTGIEEAHPSSPTIVAYEEGTLDPKSALHLRAHMLFCDTCAESYYLLKRMRAPSWMEVAIGMVQSAKDFLLEPLELGGMGEFLPAPAAVARGESPGTGAIEMLQHLSDAGGDADLRLFIEPNAGKQASASLRAALAPARPWTATLRDAHERELASIPLKAESQVLHPALQPESYVIQVFKDKGPLAECRLDIRICDEPAPAHRDH